jgi:glycerol-3-phosphate acyltransferase PlsX
MSGDLGPRVVIAAAYQIMTSYPDVELILVGDQHILAPLLIPSAPSNRLRIHHAPDRVSMDEDPLTALRQKKQSSMWLALVLVRDGLADACVSAGNTGALLAMGKHLLKTFPGIERPAICKSMPVFTGRTYMLDLGANPTCTANQLAQFALMGSVLAAATASKEARVMLLNIGTEETKGTEAIKSAQELLRADSRINYRGYIEADQIYSGGADVIVCDGFAGNVALKASEGVAKLITKKLHASFRQQWWGKIIGLCLRPITRQVREELDPGRYNGAIFLGLQKTVVKSHGGADQSAFVHALVVAIEQVIERVPEKIRQQLDNQMLV